LLVTQSAESIDFTKSIIVIQDQFGEYVNQMVLILVNWDGFISFYQLVNLAQLYLLKLYFLY